MNDLIGLRKGLYEKDYKQLVTHFKAQKYEEYWAKSFAKHANKKQLVSTHYQ